MTTTAAPATRSPRERLRAADDKLAELRSKRAEISARKERLAAEVAADSRPIADNPKFAAAQQAVKELGKIDDEIAAQEQEISRLGMMLGGDRPAGPNGAEPIDNHASADTLLAEDGKWLQRVLLDHASVVPGALDKLASSGVMAAVEGAFDTSEGGTTATARAVVEAFRPRSALAAAGVPILPIDSTQSKVPWVKSRPEAGWSAEGASFAKGAPPVEMVDVEPKRCGLVSPLSVEVYEDVTPATLAAVQRAILDAVAFEADAGLIAGKGEGAVPLGIIERLGIGAVEGPLTDLAPFIAAAAKILANDATPAACFLNPEDAQVLAEVVEFGAPEAGAEEEPAAVATSRKPLVGIAREFTIPALPESRFHVTNAITKGTALMLDPLAAAIVLRRRADLSVDPFYDFDDGLMAIRSYLRADVLVQPDGICKVTFK